MADPGTVVGSFTMTGKINGGNIKMFYQKS